MRTKELGSSGDPSNADEPIYDPIGFITIPRDHSVPSPVRGEKRKAAERLQREYQRRFEQSQSTRLLNMHIEAAGLGDNFSITREDDLTEHLFQMTIMSQTLDKRTLYSPDQPQIYLENLHASENDTVRAMVAPLDYFRVYLIWKLCLHLLLVTNAAPRFWDEAGEPTWQLAFMHEIVRITGWTPVIDEVEQVCAAAGLHLAGRDGLSANAHLSRKERKAIQAWYRENGLD